MIIKRLPLIMPRRPIIKQNPYQENEIKMDSSLVDEKKEESILSVHSWKHTNAFKTIKEKETQIKYYKKMNSSQEVLQLVELESKPFGSVCEKMIQEIF